MVECRLIRFNIFELISSSVRNLMMKIRCVLMVNLLNMFFLDFIFVFFIMDLLCGFVVLMCLVCVDKVVLLLFGNISIFCIRGIGLGCRK